ncbi:MAG: uracil-DNA glycosylase [Candidatus Omnitrophica bacterium]|nr:uracil-DNA glycosylase [Candidatus Omnitrophota bacterium]
MEASDPGQNISECKWYQFCPMKRYFEKGNLDKKWIESYCWRAGKDCLRYQMQENGRYHPDWMLPDGSIDDSLKGF